MLIDWKKEEKCQKNTSSKHRKEVNVNKVWRVSQIFGMETARETVRQGIQIGQNNSGWKIFCLFSKVIQPVKAF